MEYNHLDPETWKLKCTTCETFVQYEKLYRYHNAKSRNTKGQPICCDNCKGAKLKVSKNPEDWEIPCSTCNNPIRYDNLASFRVVYGGYLKGNKRECESCSSLTRKNVVRKDRIYSRDPKDWVVDCGNPNCTRQITYTSLKSYQGSMSRRKKGDPPLCFSCVSNKLDKTTKEWGDKTRASMATRFLNTNKIDGFRPFYNKNTIAYIESVLNDRFNTTFIHAESNNGEYRIYDRELKSFYFADAYCPKLNIWIEFDERYKFDGGILKRPHISRHERIQILLKCHIIRIKFTKTNNSKKYIWYYDDTRYWGNLRCPISKYNLETVSFNLNNK